MTDDKPLHVRVAEALGCKPEFGSDWVCTCPRQDGVGDRPHGDHRSDVCHSHSGLNCDMDALALYDTDWSATGPLIERFGISLALHHQPPTEWVAFINRIGLIWSPDAFGLDGYAEEFEYGHTPLVAVCNLILALKAAGKLIP